MFEDEERLPLVIGNRNIPKNCCSQRFCDAKSTHYVNLKFNEMELTIELCNKHADEWYKNGDIRMLKKNKWFVKKNEAT